MAQDSSKATAKIIVLLSIECFSGLRVMPSMAWQQIQASPNELAIPVQTEMAAAKASMPSWLLPPSVEPVDVAALEAAARKLTKLTICFPPYMVGLFSAGRVTWPS